MFGSVLGFFMEKLIKREEGPPPPLQAFYATNTLTYIFSPPRFCSFPTLVVTLKVSNIHVGRIEDRHSSSSTVVLP